MIQLILLFDMNNVETEIRVITGRFLRLETDCKLYDNYCSLTFLIIVFIVMINMFFFFFFAASADKKWI